jgi:hypothetical protein
MPLRSSARMLTPVVAVLALAVAGTSPALARHGRDGGGGGGSGGSGGGGGGDRSRSEIRVAGTCGSGASSKLKLKSRDGQIEAEFEVHGRAGSAWRVTIVHEREVEYRGSRRIGGASRSFEVSYRMPDYSGADTVAVRAAGPRGLVCVAAATLPA